MTPPLSDSLTRRAVLGQMAVWATGTSGLGRRGWAAPPAPPAPATSTTEAAKIDNVVITGHADERLNSFDALLADFVRRYRVPGAALAVADQDRLVYARGFGWSDVQKKTPVFPTSLFRIASISKPLTATCILKLAESQQLSLDDRVLDLLPRHAELHDLPKPKDERWHRITVAHLLHHTAGWDRDRSFDPMFRAVQIARYLSVTPPAGPLDVIRYMLDQPLDFEPGTRYAYSNFGYCLLGRILEAQSGQSYETCMRQIVLDPLGLRRPRLGRTRTTASFEVRYYDEQAGEGPCVFADHLGQSVPQPYGAWNLEAMDAHGGWIASAVDLVRFSMALHSEGRSLLSDPLRNTMFTKPPGDVRPSSAPGDEQVYYGCGWLVRPHGKQFNCWHTGSLPGTSTLLVRRHDNRHWAVLFNTRNTPDGKRLSSVIDPLLHRAADQVQVWPDRDLSDL